MAISPQKIADIFKTVGQPTITYVKRDNGKFELQLNSSLNERGQLCLLTGPSKTGKTTLYREVLANRKEQPLVVQCDRNTNCNDIWKRALEAIDFERLTQSVISKSTKGAVETETSGRLGWGSLAEITARIKASLGLETTSTDTKSRVLAEPGPDLLIPILASTNAILVIEDFHYLMDEEKRILFQQWKRFIDNEIPVLVLGTTHRAVDIANSNRDLVGRISQIDVGHWQQADLEAICDKGFGYLSTTAETGFKKKIAEEAVGLPIIVQQACLDLYASRNIETVDVAKSKKLLFKRRDAECALHNVATQKYTQFESYYNTLIRGPREKARKYRTYELVLACFTLDPIRFNLHRADIDNRMQRLDLSPAERPPAPSISSTLGALKKFQEKRELDLLEWRQSEDTLYIIEPAFLFYVRWRASRSGESKQLDFLSQLLVKVARAFQATDFK